LQHEVRGAKGGECLASSQAKDLAQTFSKLLGRRLVGRVRITAIAKVGGKGRHGN
jgi:hypothetical protein